MVGLKGNLAPDGAIVAPAANLTITTGDAVDFAGSAGDPDGDLPLSYLWQFGPGSGVADTTALNPGSLQFDNPGTFTVTLTVTDSRGQADPHADEQGRSMLGK